MTTRRDGVMPSTGARSVLTAPRGRVPLGELFAFQLVHLHPTTCRAGRRMRAAATPDDASSVLQRIAPIVSKQPLLPANRLRQSGRDATRLQAALLGRSAEADRPGGQ